MKPKNMSLFYLALVMGLIGVWLFAFSIYWIAVEPMNPDYCCGANIGAGLVGLFSQFLGLVAVALLVLSYAIKPKK